MKKQILLIAVSLILFSCESRQDKYVAWLYRYMPMPDEMQYDRQFWDSNVAKTLEIRDRMGWNIPEREFRHFVLPLRVNNENLDDFRTTYADTLCARVQGMSLADAALEINHWCHEQATYQPSDARTGSPEEVILRGVGRCGEESVLAVAALRAAGIPARQVYTPRWAHTDDNHAWVEVWTGDGWHFMGACEPEAVLDMGWFNGAVSRAMILHTKVYGDYKGPEDVIKRTPCYTEINVIRGYVPARRTHVSIKEDGKPAAGASVSFRIYNYAEFYNVVTYQADSEGNAALDTGLGDMFVLAWKGNRFGYGVASGEQLTIELNHYFGEAFADSLEIVPPRENPIVTNADEAMKAQNSRRLAQEDSIRLAHDHVNHALERFREAYPDKADAIIDLLADKDRADVRYDVLEDALLGSGSPRVELERLLPFRREVRDSDELKNLSTPAEVMDWCQRNITIDNSRNPQNLRISPAAVWRHRKADDMGFKIFYVALCRALGMDAEYDPVTGQIDKSAPQAYLKPLSDKYFRDYSLSSFSPDGTKLLDYESGLPKILSVDEGYYLLTTGRRMADGSVLVRLEFFGLQDGQLKELNPIVRTSSDRPTVIGSMDPEAMIKVDGAAAPQSLLSATGRGYFLLAIMGHRDEPTSHAKTELEAAAAMINGWGRPVVVLGKTRPEGIENAITGIDETVLGTLPQPHQLPVIAVCDSFGRVVYFSSGYNTSLASDLESIIPKL
ncbi:MAG: transglutaminase domain-containing protein [Bacteroidales bacterium]|nr:transglutaminase domain-containing protein [Bacteroidales bacterium]